MTNNLRQIKKDLCTFAKKHKGFRYTDSALVTFLMTGAIFNSRNLFSASETNGLNIQKQKQAISTSMADIHQNLKKVRLENDRLLRGTNLELIQLMEQGDHVVKSPWSSWQFGASYYYSSLDNSYKGRGDKSEKYPYSKLLSRSGNILDRTVSPLSSKSGLTSSVLRGSSYGNADLKDVDEPSVEWEVSANVNPRRVEKVTPLVLALQPAVDFQNPELPVFEIPDGDIEVAYIPPAPDTTVTTTRLNFSVDDGDYSNIQQSWGQPLLAGTPKTDPVGPVSQADIKGENGRGKLEISHNNTDKFTLTTNNTAFRGIEGNDHHTVFNYSSDLNREFKYLDEFGAMGARFGGGHDFVIENMDVVSSGTLKEVVNGSGGAYRNTFYIFELNGHQNEITTATLKNNSTVTVNSPSTSAVLLLNYGSSSKAIKFTNEGIMKASEKHSSIVSFLNYGNSRVSNFTNRGEIILDGKGSSVAQDTFNNNINYYTFVNDGKITLAGENNYGVDLTAVTPANRNPVSIFQLNNPIVAEGKNINAFNIVRLSRRRRFQAVVDGQLQKSFFNVELHGQNNTGMRIGNGQNLESGEVKFKNFKLVSVDGKENRLVRINRQNDIKFSDEEDNRELTIEGGEGNIAFHVQKSTGALNEGEITIKNSVNGASKNSTGIVSTADSEIENKGKMNISGDRVRALYVSKNGKIENHGEITFNGTTTDQNKGSVGMYANQGGTIESDSTAKITVSAPKSAGLFAENRKDDGDYLGNSVIKVSRAEITATDGAFNVLANKGGEIIFGNDVILNTGKDSLTFYTAYSPFSPGGKIIFNSTVTANIKNGGTVFYYDLANAPIGSFDFSTWYANNFTHNNGSKLKLNMENGGRVLFLANGNLLLSGVPTNFSTGGQIEISGSSYTPAALVNSTLEIDKDVNLDDGADSYNQLEIVSSSITNSKVVTGSKNGQIAMAQENNGSNPASKIRMINNNRIELTGEESTGIYAKRGEIINNKDISVGRKSAGIYLTEDNRGASTAGKSDNNGTITLGESSTGMLYRAGVSGAYPSLPGGIFNYGKIKSVDKNTIGMNFESPHGSKTAINRVTGEITLAGESSIGMYASGSGNYEIKNSGKITVGSSSTVNSPGIGIYTDNGNSLITNEGIVSGGEKSLGIYGHSVNTNESSDISVGKSGTGIYSLNGNLNLKGKLSVGTDEGKGVITAGNNQTVTNNLSEINLEDNSFGFVNTGNNNQIVSNSQNVSLKNRNVFLYSENSTGNIINNTRIVTSGNQNYGIYTAGTAFNEAEIDMRYGTGNVGVYSMGQQTAFNSSVIRVGESRPDEKLYSIGMAAGYYDKDRGTSVYTGKVENTNTGKIEVSGKNGIGMYAAGRGSVAVNNGEINLTGKGSVGMFLDQEAVGINNGKITATADAIGAVGAVAMNRAVFKNYGTISILPEGGVGVLIKRDGILEEYSSPASVVPQDGESSISARTRIQNSKLPKTGKELPDSSVEIISPAGDRIPEIKINGKVVNPVEFDVSLNSAGTKIIGEGGSVTHISDLAGDIHNSNAGAGKIGMYIDTSGVRFTNPIQGLNNLSHEVEVDLIIGTEAARYTNSKAIKIKENVLAPYNATILSNAQIKKWHVYSGSLTWVGTIQSNEDGDQIKAAYLAKIPYTSFAKDSNVYNFADGLEQRYSMNSMDSREKILFNKLNDIGKNEKMLLAQAFDEMMGHQYANVQHRIHATGEILDNQTEQLLRGWNTKSRQSNKITTFGMKGEYTTETAGITDYTNNAYGFAYIHENETVKIGNSTGWYAGMVNNRFRFKDIGKSKENQTMLKVGLFKVMTPESDYNGSLQWKVSGEGYVAKNSMDRRYLVVDDIFRAKSDYTSYGVAIRNEIGKEFRAGEKFIVKPYGNLKIEYGRFERIKEKSGEMKLQVRGDNYISVKPGLGLEFRYKRPVAVKTSFVTGLDIGYSTELGKVDNTGNRVKVSETTADYYTLRGEKEDRKGNFKADFNVGIENSRFGVTLNAGYRTKGDNVRGGIGFRAIY